MLVFFFITSVIAAAAMSRAEMAEKSEIKIQDEQHADRAEANRNNLFFTSISPYLNNDSPISPLFVNSVGRMSRYLLCFLLILDFYSCEANIFKHFLGGKRFQKRVNGKGGQDTIYTSPILPLKPIE